MRLKEKWDESKVHRSHIQRHFCLKSPNTIVSLVLFAHAHVHHSTQLQWRVGRVQALPFPLWLGLPLYPSAERQGHGPDISQRSPQQITSNKAFRKAPLTTATQRERERDGLQPWQQIQSAPIKSSLGETGSLDLIMITERRMEICI